MTAAVNTKFASLTGQQKPLKRTTVIFDKLEALNYQMKSFSRRQHNIVEVECTKISAIFS